MTAPDISPIPWSSTAAASSSAAEEASEEEGKQEEGKEEGEEEEEVKGEEEEEEGKAKEEVTDEQGTADERNTDEEKGVVASRSPEEAEVAEEAATAAEEENAGAGEEEPETHTQEGSLAAAAAAAAVAAAGEKETAAATTTAAEVNWEAGASEDMEVMEAPAWAARTAAAAAVERGLPSCPGMAISVYSNSGFAKSGARVSLSCSSKRLFAHACFAPQSIALAPGHVAVLYSAEDYSGDRTLIAEPAEELTGRVRSVLVCATTTNSTAGLNAKCVPGSTHALPLCEEEVAGDRLSEAAALSKTDAARFGYLGKGIKARKFRPVEGEGLLLKSMGAELRQEACFYKEVIQDIARGCGPDDPALRALVNEGHVVKFSGVALMERGTCGGGGGGSGGGRGSGGGGGVDAAGEVSSAPRVGGKKRLEFLAIEDLLHGLTNSSLIDIDVSGAPNAVCRMCSVDVKNFKTWDHVKGQRVVGDRIWWKKEARCDSRKVSGGQGLTLVLFSAQLEPFLTQNTPHYPLTPPKQPQRIPKCAPYPIESA